MGTLREDAVLSSSSFSSDPDMSSSEQSCDTVIYVGPNGHPLSDRDLTDNEGPPAMLPIMPRTSKLPPKSPVHSGGSKSSGSKSGGSKSSGSKSSSGDDEVAMLSAMQMDESSQGILHKSTLPKTGAMNTRLPPSGRLTPPGCISSGMSLPGSAPGGPTPGVVQLPRKINLKGKQAALCKAKAYDQAEQIVNIHESPLRTPKKVNFATGEGSEQWIDGPHHPQPSEGEQWIDGPGVPEQWIDVHQHHQMYEASMNVPGAQWVDGPNLAREKPEPIPTRGEQWVDGPREFYIEQQLQDPRSPKPERTGKMWTKPAPPPRGQSLENWAAMIIQEHHNPHRKETSPHRTETSPHRKELSPHRKETSPHRKESSPHRKETSPHRTETSPHRKESSPHRKESSPHRKESSPHRKESSPHRKEHSSHKTETSPHRKEGSPHKSAHKAKHGHSGHMLRNPVLVQVAGDRPISQTSESNTSLAANVSQPVSMTSGDISDVDPRLQKGPSLGPPAMQGSNTLPSVPGKSFVRDWVEKHSMISTEMAGVVTRADNSQVFNEALKQRTEGDGHQHGHHRHHSVSEVPFNKHHNIPDSGQISSTHSSPRNKRRLKRITLPPPEHPHNRIAEWVQSVHDASQSAPNSPLQKQVSSQQQLLAPECDQGFMSADAPPPYELCVDEDVDMIDIDSLSQVDGHAAMPTMNGSDLDYPVSDGGVDSRSAKSEEAKKDEAQPQHQEVEVEVVPVDLNESINTQTSTDDNSMSQNVGSIYELEMDEQLESVKQDQSWRNTFTSEDEVSSNTSSLPKKKAEPIEQINDEKSPVESDMGVQYEEAEASEVDQHMTPLTVNADMRLGSDGAENLSPPSSDDSDKPKRITRPTSLRRPDGASNPNLSQSAEVAKPIEEMPEFLKSEIITNLEPEVIKRSVMGQSPDEEIIKKTIPPPTKIVQLSQVSPTKPAVPAKPGLKLVSPGSKLVSPGSKLVSPGSKLASPGSKLGSPTSKLSSPSSKLSSPSSKPTSPTSKASSPTSKPSVLPKPTSKKASSKATDSKASTPSKPSSKLCLKSPSVISSKSSSASSSPTKSAKDKPKDSNDKSSKDSKEKCSIFKLNRDKSKDKEKGKDKNKPSSKPTSPVTSNKSGKQSALTRFSSSLSKLPTSKNKNQSSPTKSSTSSSSKDSKSSSKSCSKSPSPSKKDSKLPVSKASNSRVTELTGHTVSRATDSDSGNDSGIVKNDKKPSKLLSPYSTVTNPRVSSHSSSGHGSDNSSNFSAHRMGVTTPGSKTSKAEVSSGYESMIRDSEVTGTSSSTQDSTSESSSGGRIHGNRILKKKIQGKNLHIY